MDLSLEAGDQLQIEQLELSARIGVTEQERATPQRLVVTMTLWPTARAEQLRDQIKRAVNYSEVATTARDFGDQASFALVETMAAELATLLLDSFDLRAVRVELRKFVLTDAKYVAATVTRFTQKHG